jgi:putative ABC transport system permease protein
VSLTQLAWRNMARHAFRSGLVAGCAFLLAALTLAATWIIYGSRASLQQTSERLGADLLVVPAGSQTNVESALLMGRPVSAWMPAEALSLVARVPGVGRASPQIYLSTLAGASCCSASEMFLVVFDPTTDFTLRPWLQQQAVKELAGDEALGGSKVFIPPGQTHIRVYGTALRLKGNLASTGTGLDQTLFMSWATAQDIARMSKALAEQELTIPTNSISAILIKIKPGADLNQVSDRIARQISGVTVIPSPGLFQASRQQISALGHLSRTFLFVVWFLALGIIGLVFSLAVHERRREVGVLRALGATRSFVFRGLLMEACLLALGGGLAGATLSGLALWLFRPALLAVFQIPFLFPSLPLALGLIALGLLAALGCVGLGVLLPAVHVTRMDPASAMRE